jgi:N6-L-threonylcarbamoyladenine synthase
MARGLILGIETSCDETAAAVVERGQRTLSSVVASQIATHARYGGVVPELASREHLRAIVPVVRAALEQAQLTLAELDAIAVTSGPGLAGALLVGITYAKALAFANRLPLIAVNHLEGHIHAVLLHERENASVAKVPTDSSASPACAEAAIYQDGEDTDREEASLALVVSGGHTHLYRARPVEGTWHYSLVGRTVDDAAGEAYDKVAKLLGLGYPGGPWIDALAQYGNPRAVPFAFAQVKTKAHLAGKAPRTKAAQTAPIARLDPRFLFSFSGIKTAVLRYVDLHGMRPAAEARAARLYPRRNVDEEPPNPSGAEALDHSEPDTAPLKPRPGTFCSAEESFAQFAKPPQSREEALALCPQSTLDLIASFQHAVVGDLIKKTFAAAESLGAKRILVTGGVAANRELRARFSGEARRSGLRVSFPTLSLSTDNAAMIAAAAWPRFLARDFAPEELTADPALALR